MHKQITKKVIETIHLPEARELLLRDTELKGFKVTLPKTLVSLQLDDFTSSIQIKLSENKYRVSEQQ